MAGAVIGEVGGWLCLLLRIGNDGFICDLQITDDDSFCVAGAVFGEVGG